MGLPVRPALHRRDMGSDGKSPVETVAGEGKGLVVEVYKDVGKPVLAPVGGLAGGLVKLVLWPVKLAVDSVNSQLEKLSARVEAKLGPVPIEHRVPAPATVAGPAALQYSLLGDGDDVAELRELFENLLARSIDVETTRHVHPAFVGMISQMTPDEARILRSITQSEYAAAHVQDFSGGESNGVARGLRSLLGHGIGIDETRLPEYISNLARLGIVRVDWGMSTTVDYDAYARIEEIVKAELRVDDADRKLNFMAGVILVTALGAQFLNMCVPNGDRRLVPARYS